MSAKKGLCYTGKIADLVQWLDCLLRVYGRDVTVAEVIEAAKA